jgi:hypothetical protein
MVFFLSEGQAGRREGPAGGRREHQVSDLYAPTLKAPKARLLAAITAKLGCLLLKTNTLQAFLYGEMREGICVCIPPPDW